MDDLTAASATALARAIRDNEVSSVEVIDAHLCRIEAVNQAINAVVQLAADRARAEARAADAALARGDAVGPFHGVPVTIKDSFDTTGIVSTWGTTGRADFVPDRDAAVVARLRAAGAIVLGKTNTPELTLAFDTDNLVYGRTNNPHDLLRSAGGSSGGAAAIVAAGGSPLDIGSDTAGSIRLPVHWCGACGLKPTAGRVPKAGHCISSAGFTGMLTQVGPIARCVEDLALVLPIVAGVDGRDPTVVPMPLDVPGAAGLGRLRVAFHTDNGIVSPTAETAETVRRVAGLLADAGADVSERRPEGIERSQTLFIALMRADGGASVRRLLGRCGTTRPHSYLDWAKEGQPALSSADLTALLASLDSFRGGLLAFMDAYDLILCPVSVCPAVPHGEAATSEMSAGFAYTKTYNLTGWPAVVVPAGTSPEGLPIGVQIVARPWREDLALAAAQHVESARPNQKDPGPPCGFAIPVSARR